MVPVLQHTRQTRITANLVGMMIFVQVILGGGSFVLGWDVIYHLVWGTLTFIVLIAATVLARRDFGVDSTLFKVGLAAIVDFVIQGILGLFSLGSGVAIVVHLTNAFLLTGSGIVVSVSNFQIDSASSTTVRAYFTEP